MAEWFTEFGPAALTAAGWVMTFALHSTVALCLALAVRCVAVLRPFEETALQIALIASTVTTVVACSGASFAPDLLRFELVDTAAPSAVAVELGPLAGGIGAGATGPSTAGPVAGGVAMESVRAWQVFLGAWPLWALGLYTLIVLGLGLRIAARWWRGRRWLLDRRDVDQPEALALLAQLRQSAGLRRAVRLTTSANLDSPIAFGLFHHEICVPPAVLDAMDARHQRCVLGHEVAHLRHRDAWWRLGLVALTTVAFFQPLLFLVRRRLHELAEYRCDGWVVRTFEDRAGMANALVEVAGWIVHPNAPRLLAATMADRHSPLRERVQRILNAPTERTMPSRFLAAMGVLTLLAAGYAMPAVTVGPPQVPPSGLQQQLRRLEVQIADLHEHLASAWRKLAGRDDPRYVKTLQAVEGQLARFTKRHRALCAEAAQAAAARRVSESEQKPLDNNQSSKR